MAISVVNTRAANNASGFTGSIALAYGGNLTPGSLLVAVVVATDGVTISSVVDGANGAWTLDKAATPNGNTGYVTSIYSFPNNASSGAPTVTATFSSTCRNTIHLFELIGAATSSVVDTTGETAPNGTNPSISLTTGSNNCCIIGGMNTYDSTWVITAGTNFTLVSNETTGNTSTAGEHWADSGAAGSKTVGFTIASGAGGYSAMGAVAYKVAATSPTPSAGTATLAGVAGRNDRGLFTRTMIRG